MSLCASNQMLLEGAHVAEHSLGGVVALQLALETPERVHSLVLLEAGILDVIGPDYRCCLTIVATRQEQKPAEAARRGAGNPAVETPVLQGRLPALGRGDRARWAVGEHHRLDAASL
jgi:pimeloyl-ACP methyl ester carboxylesterase